MPSPGRVQQIVRARGRPLVVRDRRDDSERQVWGRLHDVSDERVDGVSVLADDRMVFFAALDFPEPPDPARHDLIESGTILQVLSVKPRYWRGLPSAYVLHVRAA